MSEVPTSMPGESLKESAPILVSNFVSLHFPCFLATYWVKFLLLAFAPVLAAKTLNARRPWDSRGEALSKMTLPLRFLASPLVEHAPSKTVIRGLRKRLNPSRVTAKVDPVDPGQVQDWLRLSLWGFPFCRRCVPTPRSRAVRAVAPGVAPARRRPCSPAFEGSRRSCRLLGQPRATLTEAARLRQANQRELGPL
jgi:hypothetical protein